MPASLDKFVPLIDGQITGCPDVMARDAARDAAIEFCNRTRLISLTTEVDVLQGESRTLLFPPDGEVFVVEHLYRDKTPLTRLSRHDFELDRLHIQDGAPWAYYVDGDRQMMLGPTPTANETLIGHFIIRPSDTASSVPDRLWTDWRQGIVAGARAFIRNRHLPWSDPALEAKDRDEFEQAIAAANLDRAQGGTRRPLRARGYWF